MEYYFERYGDLELHRRMIGDRWRTDAFAAGIAEVVKPGDVVLDVGTGTGILAMLAAKAGARRVYAVDQAAITQTAANLAKANGLSDVITVLRGPAQELVLDEPVDVLISEWLGNLAFVEGMLDDVLIARDHHLRPGGAMVPGRVDVRLAPLDDPVLYASEGPGYWRRPVHGLDLTTLEKIELEQGRGVQLRIDPAALIARPRDLVGFDLADADARSPWVEGRVEFDALADGHVNGFAGWFVLGLAPGVTLDTGPDSPETHWAQSYLSFPPRPVRAGQRLTVEYALERDPEEKRYVRLDLSLDDVHQSYRLE